MSNVKDLLSKEAAMFVSVIVAFLTEVIGLLVAFGIDVSEAQRNAIVSTVTSAAVVIFLVGPVIRSLVFSRNTAKQIAQKSADTGKPTLHP